MPDGHIESSFGRPLASGKGQLRILREPYEVEQLKPAWQALIEGEGRPVSTFQTPDWILALLYHQFRQLKPTPVRVVAVETQRELVLVAPLALISRSGIRVLQWLGEPLSAYGDVVVHRTCDVAALMKEVVDCLQEQGDSIDIIHLPKTRADAAIMPFLKNFSRVPFTNKRAPYLDLTSFRDFDAYVASRSRSAMKAYRRKRRRLAEQGRLEFRVHPAGDQAEALGHYAIELKTKWMKTYGKVSRVFADPRHLASLMEFLRTKNSGARVSELSLDSTPIAIEIGFVTNRSYYSYLGAMDLDHSRYSPGQLQLLDTLEWCFREGIEVFDLLPSDSEYKRAWATHHADENEWTYFCTLKGALYEKLVLKSLLPLSRKLYSRTPMAIRRPAQAWVHRVLRE